MSAERLRAAADKIREAVEVSSSQPEVGATVRGVWLNARYYPVLPTAAALAVAEWLDRKAERAEDMWLTSGQQMRGPEWLDAIAVADAYLDGAR